MKGDLLGPYRLEAELGSGGMGTVWRARGPEGRVAVKVVHPHLLGTPGFRERFDREARLGMAIAHPNVVRTLACLEVEHGGGRVPAVVLEYVEGQTLAGLLSGAGRVPEDLCRHVGQEIAAGLAAIHGAGVVHRDLKPGNVMITPEHHVKVMDLGLARHSTGEDRLSATGVFVGTAAYSPPEQLRGTRELDPRSDLYSLGAMLYELATGRLPFEGESFAEVMARILRGVPERPGRLAPQLSPFLEELVMALLARRPEERPGSAESLVAILREGEAGAWWRETSARVVAETRRPLRRIRIPRESGLWGRESALAGLRALWEEAEAGRGGVLLLDGEAGIGKSRLVDEFLAGFEPEEAHVLVGGWTPGGSGNAFATAFGSHLGDDEEAVRRALPDTPLLVPGFRAILRGETPPPGAVPLHRDTLPTVFVHAMRALAAEKPLLILVEDLHFAPEEGRALFTALACAVPGHRVLLLGTARPGLPADWTAALARYDHVARRTIERLDPPTVERHLGILLGGTPAAEALASRIAGKADGNPYFVFEILRSLRESGIVARSGEGRWSVLREAGGIGVPASIRELVAGRVAGLGEDDRAVLEAASCQGCEFDGRLAAEALGRPLLDVLRRLGWLERETSLVRAAGRRFAFDHHLAHEVILDSLPQALREGYHAATADALERRLGAAAARPGDVDGATCADLAWHFLSGAAGERGLRYLDPALDHLERTFRHERAIALADLALAAPGVLAGARRGELLLRKATRHDMLGQRDRQKASIEEGTALADASGDASLLAKARVSMGAFHYRISRQEEARALLEEGLAFAREAGDRKGEAAAVLNLGAVAAALSRYEEARERFERCLAIARETGNRADEAIATGHLGSVALSLGRLVEAKDLYERHLAIAREVGDREGESNATGNLGVTLSEMGRHAEARDLLERAVAISREIGSRRGEGVYLGNLGNVLRVLGLDREGRAALERTIAIWREVGNLSGEALATGNLGLYYLREERLDEARALFEREAELAREAGHRRAEAIALVNLGPLRARLGDPAGARRDLEASLALCRAIGAQYPEGYALLGLAGVAGEEGDAAAADRYAGEAIAVRRKIGHHDAEAEALVARGAVRARGGRLAEARADYEAALAIARELSAPVIEYSALAHLAALPGGDAAPALDLLARRGEEVDTMEGRFLLWRATGDPVHLREARRRLDDLVDRAPPTCREAMRRNLRLHREIDEEAGALPREA